MDTDPIERCPEHPDREPVTFDVGRTRSHQSDYPTRVITVRGCPVCGPQI